MSRRAGRARDAAAIPYPSGLKTLPSNKIKGLAPDGQPVLSGVSYPGSAMPCVPNT